jgi:prepilin-type N-terminal cleavage/methylation domain-containing protein
MRLEFYRRINFHRGFTLVEIGIVTAIVSIIVGLSIAKTPALLLNYRVSGETTELPQVVSNIQKIYFNSASYSGVVLDAIIRYDAFPENRVTIPSAGAATATNRWGGAITFAAGTINSVGDIGRFVYSSVPQADCKAVILNVAPGFRRIYVDSSNSASVGAGVVVKADSAVIDLVALGSACGNLNSITYDFAK